MRMKKIISWSLTCTLIIFGLGFYQLAFTKEDGAPSGKTNSPGDGETCTQVDCHTGTAKPRSGLLTTDVSEAGYLSTDTLTITVSIEFPGRSTFGFQASAQTLDGDKIGKIIVTDDVQTKTTSVGKYITHEKEGIDGSDGKSWSFDWTPLSASGDVTFYYAVNAADGDGESTGDSVYYGSFTISENPDNVPLALQETGDLQSFSVLNPVENNIVIQPLQNDMMYRVTVFDISGRLVMSPSSELSGTAVLPAEALAPGIYFIEIFNGMQYFSKRLVKT